jgi:hypothetical protein
LVTIPPSAPPKNATRASRLQDPFVTAGG